MRERATAEVIVVLAAVLLACGPPDAQYRHTGAAPAARVLTWDGHTVREGNLRIEAAYTGTSIDTNNSPDLHDTALHIPERTVDAVATIGVSDQVELGARGSFAAYSWMTESARGTMSIPGRPNMLGIGPEFRWSIPVSDSGTFRVGLALNALHYNLPVARWRRVDCAPDPLNPLNPAPCPCPAGKVCEEAPTENGERTYELVAEGTESFFVLNAAVYPSVSIGPEGKYGHLFFGGSVHDTFKNDGFTDEIRTEEGSTLESSDLLLFVGAGYGIAFAGVRASGMFYIPTTRNEDEVAFGPGFFVSLGGAVPIWGPDAQ
jgi:hypothetical protein